MKRALAALLAAPLLLTACTNEPETAAVTETETQDSANPDWKTIPEMQGGLDSITGECNEDINQRDNVGSCSNGQTMLLYGLGEHGISIVEVNAFSPDFGTEGYVVENSEWSVYCAMNEGEDLTIAENLCSQILQVKPESEWNVSGKDDKIAAYSQEVEQAPTETTPPEPATTFTDGTHMVGSDIQPGTYRNAGNETCYWARLSGFGGTVEDIIANENPRGQAFVTIGADDAAFKSQLCGTWELVE